MIADLVFRNGHVFTSDRDRLRAHSLAVSGERIVALDEDAEGLIGPSTEILDLEGRMMTPGFIDAHCHVSTSGLDLLRVPLTDCADAGEAIASIAHYAEENPDLPWILGSGWHQTWFPRACPPKELLDRVVPDRPVLLENADGHDAWVNTRALEIAGITAATPDPMYGRIERNPDGSPQGTLHEGGAVGLVARFAPAETVDDFVAGITRAQEGFLGFGITGWQDAHVEPLVHEAYLRLAHSGGLKGRVVGAMWWHRDRGLEQVDELLERRHEDGPNFRPISVKLMLDGVVENYTAAMLDGYYDGAGTQVENTGIDFIDPGLLKEAVSILDAHGFQCHFHAIGDRAVRSALDAIEEARRRNGTSRNRHHLSHIQVIHPEDIPRFAGLDAVANAQPLWACHERTQRELTIPFLGPKRSGWQYPFASLLSSGARLGMGSDWAVSTANVMEEIDVAVTRTCDSGEPLIASEAISAEEALIAFTAGSAYINHAETDTGSIEVGKQADLVVLDRDPTTDGPFRDTRVAMTLIGGTVVYEG